MNYKIDSKNSREIKNYFEFCKKIASKAVDLNKPAPINTSKYKEDMYALLVVYTFGKFESCLKEIINYFIETNIKAKSENDEKEIKKLLKENIKKHTIKYPKDSKKFFKENLYVPGIINLEANYFKNEKLKNVIIKISDAYKTRNEIVHSGEIKLFQITEIIEVLVYNTWILYYIDKIVNGANSKNRKISLKIQYNEEHYPIKFETELQPENLKIYLNT